MFIITKSDGINTIGDLRRAISAFNDECEINELIISYQYNTEKCGKILVQMAEYNKKSEQLNDDKG